MGSSVQLIWGERTEIASAPIAVSCPSSLTNQLDWRMVSNLQKSLQKSIEMPEKTSKFSTARAMRTSKQKTIQNIQL